MISDAILRELLFELLNEGKKVRFRAKGWSMYPSIRDGELVTVTPVGLGDIKAGDVLAYQNKKTKKIVVHRLINIRRPNTGPSAILLFAGDSSLCYDAPVYGSDYLLGKVIAVERNGTRMSLERKLNCVRGWFRVQIVLFCPRRLWVLVRGERLGAARMIRVFRQFSGVRGG